jgi:hypothetical protein
MFKWLEKIVRFPSLNEARKVTVYDVEETERIISKARHAEERFDTEFNSLMYQLEIAKRKRGEE